MNTHRISFLDIARGLAVFFMIMQHAILVYAVDQGDGSWLGELLLLLGTAPAAPVFMMVMGIFFVRSRTTTVMPGILRGLYLLGLGYVLNLFRFVFPLLLIRQIDPASLAGQSISALFFTGDIFQLAGLSLIAMALIKRFIPWRQTWPALALGICVISPALWGALDGVPGTALLWGNAENMHFPIFPWLMYPLLGMFYSRYLFETNDLSGTMTNTAIAGGYMVGAGLVLWNRFQIGDYARSELGVHAAIMGVVCLWLPGCWWMAQKLSNTWLLRQITFWSRQVTPIYMIQWILFGWGILVFGENQLSPGMAFGIGIIVLIITHILTLVYAKYRHP